MPTDDQTPDAGRNMELSPPAVGEGLVRGDNRSYPSETYEFEGHRIRVGRFSTGEQGWVVRDVAEALGLRYGSLHAPVRGFPVGEAGVITVPTPGGRQRAKAVTAAGLTRILMRTDSDRADRFRAMMATAGGSIVQTGRYVAPELPPQPNPSTAIAPANDTLSLEALAQVTETQLGLIRQMQQMQRDVQQMRSDVQRELTSYIDHAIDQRSRGLRDEMDGLRQNYDFVNDLVDDHRLEARIEDAIGHVIEQHVNRRMSEVSHDMQELLEDVGVIKQRTEPPPGKSKLDQVRHVVDAYCRHSGASHRGVWGKLYRDFAARYRVDLSKRAKKADTSVIQFVAARDRDEKTATMMLNLAHELYGYPPMVPTLPSDKYEEFEEQYRRDSEMTDRIAAEIDEDSTWH